MTTNSTIFRLLTINHAQGLMSIKNKSNLPVSSTLHYSKLKYLSTEQRLGTFEVLVFLLGRLGWTWGLITNHREIDT